MYNFPQKYVSDVTSGSSQSEVFTAGSSGRVHVKTEDAYCEPEPFLGEANPMENGVEEMKQDVKVDALSTDWLCEFEQKYWSQSSGGEREAEEARDCCRNLSVTDYEWPEDLWISVSGTHQRCLMFLSFFW